MSVEALSPMTLPLGDPALLDHSTQGYKTIILVVVCMILSTSFVGLRTYTRKFLVRSMWVDDYLAIFSVALVIAQVIEACVQVKLGAGKHIWDIQRPEDLILYNKHFYVGLVLYNISLFFVKQTLFFQYYRIIRNVRKLRRIYTSVMIFITLWMTSQLIIIGLICIPIDAFWDKTIPGNCLPMDEKAQIFMTAIGNIITDVIILLLPVPVVLRLKLRKQQKIALIGVFSLGFFACIVALFRIILVNPRRDFTYDSVSVINWSIAEVTAGLVCGVLPTLKPLISKWLPSMRPLVGNSTRGYHKYDYSTNKKGSDPNSGLSGRDTDLYGVLDFDIDLEPPHPVKLSASESGISTNFPKVGLTIPVRRLSNLRDDQWLLRSKAEGSEDEICSRPQNAENPFSTTRAANPQPEMQVRVTKEIHIRREWSIDSQVAST